MEETKNNTSKILNLENIMTCKVAYITSTDSDNDISKYKSQEEITEFLKKYHKNIGIDKYNYTFSTFLCEDTKPICFENMEILNKNVYFIDTSFSLESIQKIVKYIYKYNSNSLIFIKSYNLIKQILSSEDAIKCAYNEIKLEKRVNKTNSEELSSNTIDKNESLYLSNIALEQLNANPEGGIYDTYKTLIRYNNNKKIFNRYIKVIDKLKRITSCEQFSSTHLYDFYKLLSVDFLCKEIVSYYIEEELELSIRNPIEGGALFANIRHILNMILNLLYLEYCDLSKDYIYRTYKNENIAISMLYSLLASREFIIYENHDGEIVTVISDKGKNLMNALYYYIKNDIINADFNNIL